MDAMFDTGSMTDVLLRVFGLYYLAAGIGLFTGPDAFAKIAEELTGSALMRLISGLLALTFGAVVLALHDDWSSWQAGLVTAIGWAGLAKGVMILALPTPYLGLTNALLGRREILRPLALIVAVIGIGFLALSYF
tara:strand:+ start:703 stop:1107 length:405 start_codon:yes stop_codon:yes gene_type:complete